MLLDEVNCMRCNGIGNVLVFPQSFTSAFHIADSSDTVYNGHVVTMAGLLVIKQFGIVASGWFSFEVLDVTHFNGSRFVVISHLTVFDKYAWHSVGCCSHNVMIIKAQIAKRSRKRGIPILFACLVAQT